MKQRILDLFNSVLWRLGARITHIKQANMFETLFYRFYREDLFFLQIGANDGVRADPINKLIIRHRLRGLAVEPLPDMFQKLQQTYKGNPEVLLANVAIHRTASEIVLHRVKADAEVDDWAHGIASINSRHHELSGISAAVIKAESVPAISLSGLIESYSISKCDIFVVDTEGYDAEIINMLLDSSLRPNLVMFEHGLLQGIMDRNEYLRIVGRLMEEGYFIIAEEGDAIAYKPL